MEVPLAPLLDKEGVGGGSLPVLHDQLPATYHRLDDSRATFGNRTRKAHTKRLPL